MIIKRHGTFPTKKRENELHNKTVLQHQYKYVEDTEVNTYIFSIFWPIQFEFNI